MPSNIYNPEPSIPLGQKGDFTTAAETAIIVDGNTSTERIAKNAYVLVRNSTIEDRPDGFYKSGATIEAGTAVTAGSLSAKTIGQELKAINDAVTTVSGDVTTLSGRVDDSVSRVDSVTVSNSSSASFTLPAQGVYLVTGAGSAVALNNVCFLIGGYATASRCSVVNLTGNTTVTINNSNTSALTFTASNSNTGNSIKLFIVRLTA